MKKSLMMLVLLVFGLLLVSCSNGNVSNQQLKEDILRLEEIKDQAAKLNSMTIIERSGDTPDQEIKVSATVDYYDYEMMVDVLMSYEKNEGTWSLADHTVTIIKVIPKNEPKVTTGLKNTLMPVSNLLIQHDAFSDKDPIYTISSIESDLEQGTSEFLVEETYTVLNYTIQASYSIQANYDRNEGWKFEIADWVLLETIDWNGVYDLEWSEEIPGWPSGTLSSIYHLGDRIEGIEITGTASKSKTMKDPEHSTFQSSIHVHYAFDGQVIDVDPVNDINDFPQFTIEPLPNEDSSMIFVVGYNLGGSNARLFVDAPYMRGELTKRP